jgi:glycosyltransferase involved in cell wall biosynthesis
MKKKILFITPSLARTGSEMVLWYLINNLDRERFDTYIFCLRNGELLSEIPSDIPKEISYKGSGKWYLKAFRGLLKLFKKEPISYQLNTIQSKIKADLWFVNTLLIPQAQPMAKKIGVKVATYFHELQFAFTFIKSKEFENIIKYSDYLIGCSTTVCKTLIKTGHTNVLLQNSFIDEKQIFINPNRVAELKKQLNISKDDFVWVISGTVAYMKGLDFVIDILEHFKDKQIKIVWLGGALDNGLDNYIKTVVKVNYPNKLIFTGAVTDDYYNYLSIADGFLLPSKEESFSLVLLEASYLQIPIVAFNVGIAKNFIKDGMGILVDSFNISEMVNAIESIQQNKNIDKVLLKSAVLEYTTSKQLPLFEKLLDSL